MSLDLDKTTWKRVAFGDVVANVSVKAKVIRGRGPSTATSQASTWTPTT